MQSTCGKEAEAATSPHDAARKSLLEPVVVSVSVAETSKQPDEDSSNPLAELPQMNVAVYSVFRTATPSAGEALTRHPNDDDGVGDDAGVRGEIGSGLDVWGPGVGSAVGVPPG